MQNENILKARAAFEEYVKQGKPLSSLKRAFTNVLKSNYKQTLAQLDRQVKESCKKELYRLYQHPVLWDDQDVVKAFVERNKENAKSEFLCTLGYEEVDEDIWDNDLIRAYLKYEYIDDVAKFKYLNPTQVLNQYSKLACNPPHKVIDVKYLAIAWTEDGYAIKEAIERKVIFLKPVTLQTTVLCELYARECVVPMPEFILVFDGMYDPAFFWFEEGLSERKAEVSRLLVEHINTILKYTANTPVKFHFTIPYYRNSVWLGYKDLIDDQIRIHRDKDKSFPASMNSLRMLERQRRFFSDEDYRAVKAMMVDDIDNLYKQIHGV